MTTLWAVLLVIALLIFWLTNIAGLPGNWLVLGASVLYWIFMPVDLRAAIGSTALLVMAGLAILGEILEFVAGSAGVSKVGGSRRGAAYAILGSIAGAIVGLFVGLPIPIIGSLAASLLFGCLGAMAGAMYGERQAGRDWKQTVDVGKAAFVGRALGTVGKMAVGLAMIAVAVLGIIV